MAVMPKLLDRTPVEGVEVEYAASSGWRSSRKPRFNRARLLAITRESLELGSREAMSTGDRLTITFHTKRIPDLLRIDAEVARCGRVTVLRQQAFSVELTFDEKATAEQRAKITWLCDQFMPKRAAGAVRRDSTLAESADKEPSSPEMQPAASAPSPAPAAKPVAAPPAEDGRVNRPQALLDLIRVLDAFEVTNDLILAVVEASEAGKDVEALFPVEHARAEAESTDNLLADAAPPPREAKPIHIHRLASDTQLHFAEGGLPANPASEVFFLSRIKNPEKCFAVDLGTDAMTQEGCPSFPRGTLLVFSIAESVSGGDLAYVKMRGSDYFGQVFLDKADEVRIRFLNPSVPEIVAKRHEVRIMHKLIGWYRSL